MNAVPVLLSDALTAVINTAVTAEEFETLGFTAERSYPDWDDDFSDLKALAVDVVYVSSADAAGDEIDLDSYGTIDTTPAVDISVRKRFGHADRARPGASTGRISNTAIDPLVRLVEQLYETMTADRITAIELAAGISANWMETSVRTYCDYGRLRQGNFLGVIRVRFDVSRANG